MEEIFSVFIEEAHEQLTAMEDGLLRMEEGGGDADLLNAVFRAAHTIKGAAGVVELEHIERFTHILENLLDRVRNREIQVGSEMVTLLLQGCDHLRAMLAMVGQGNTTEDATLAAAGQNLAEGLLAFGHAAGSGGQEASREPTEGDPAPGSGWHVSVRFGPDVLRSGMDPLNFLRYLEQLGEITHLTTLCDTLPAAQEFDPESCYLGFEIQIRSQAGKQQIEDVFAFCRDDCELAVIPAGNEAVEPEAAAEDQRAESPAAAPAQAETPQPPPNIVAAQAANVADSRKPAREKRGNETRLIRVQADKLDQLIDLVGELVIAGASASLLARNSGQPHLMEANSVLSRLVEDIRDSALQLRMVQIGETFNRYNRVVRDTAREIGKDIELVINGAETELDKSVVEKIGDPLMHLVRNAMDHGIEPAEARLAAGKEACGRLELNAFHDSGNVVIEVIDDGGGVDARRVEAKAIERGLIPPDHTLTEQEIVNLVFEAGFSTADSVSKLSGRGVGMDVVRRNIEALRGSVELQTWPGQGSRFTIRLPLTLAIIDGFLTSVGTASYVIPLDSVVECLELKAVDTRGHMLNLRGEVLPFIRLRDFFDASGEPPARENVVVITAGNTKAGIVVDQLLGEFQTVIKPLSQLFRHLRGIGGSTILGSGEVALILDVHALTQLAIQREERSFSATHIPQTQTTAPVQPSFASE